MLWPHSTFGAFLALYEGFWFIAASSGTTAAAATIAPKVVIVDFYNDEQNAWYGIPEFDLLAQNISVPGLSMRYPDAHCTQDGFVCQIVTDEGEINAATTALALVLSPSFNLTQTYFLLAGDGGISPKVGTIGSVTFARYAVQVALQYEFDAREKPANFSTGYVPQGTTALGAYPLYIYGTEVFELNDDLRQRAIQFAQQASLNDTASAQAYRANYANVSDFAAATTAPSVIGCDTATSDVWWSGSLLGEAFENTTKLFTNGTGSYCSTQQEDNSVLEALLRGAIARRVDFSRVMIMRTASDFDRPYSGQDASDNLFFGQDAGYDAAVLNIYLAGVKVVQGILDGWNETFQAGVKPSNYIGDILGSLGGAPDFGPGNAFNGAAPPPSQTSAVLLRRRRATAG
ncbi:purine nucleoside permease [Amylostereum chailletii]|nr:purine nucleoside permease [Amylostereum chailletii]